MSGDIDNNTLTCPLDGRKGWMGCRGGWVIGVDRQTLKGESPNEKILDEIARLLIKKHIIHLVYG